MLTRYFTRYEELQYLQNGFEWDWEAEEHIQEKLTDWPDDIWEKDHWTCYDKEDNSWCGGFTLRRIVPDVQDML